jgi:glycosyltransferase involved in cell wall biosynthesis
VKKKVLFVIESLGCGGAEKSLVSLLSLLDRQKYDLSIWMIYPGGAFLPLLPHDVTVVEQPRYNALESMLYRLSSTLYSTVLRLNRILGMREYWGETFYKCRGWTIKAPKGQWDIVLAYHQGLVTYVVADKFHGCKKAGWVNADLSMAGYNVRYNSKFYRKYDCICPVSDIMHQLLDEQIPEFSEKYYTVWDIINPVVTRELSKQPVPRLRTTPSEYVFVTTGRLHPQKGYELAVEAAAFLQKNGLKFKWYFIGEGLERGKIERLISSYGLQQSVVLLGLQTNPYPYMAQADVYVQTSRFEGFGMTVAEAKILGLPIVSTNFEVIYDQIVHEKNGLIAEMDGEKIGEQILRLVQDDQLRERIKSAVRKEENTTCQTEVKKVEALIDRLTS